MGSTTSTITAASGTGTGNEAVTSASNSASEEISKEMFLQLLVAQIRHQNPLDPADGIEFLSQLAEFSGLEQMIGIRQELETIRAEIEAAGLESEEEIPAEENEQ